MGKLFLASNILEPKQLIYILSYTGCIQNKSITSKPVKLLYSFSTPNNYFDSINMDFIGPLQLGSTGICLIPHHITTSLSYFMTCVAIIHNMTSFI